jgi:hypothetical protein
MKVRTNNRAEFRHRVCTNFDGYQRLWVRLHQYWWGRTQKDGKVDGKKGGGETVANKGNSRDLVANTLIQWDFRILRCY